MEKGRMSRAVFCYYFCQRLGKDGSLTKELERERKAIALYSFS